MTQIDEPNLDEQIIELLKDFNGYDFCGEKACSSQAKASELIKYLKALISDQVAKADHDAYGKGFNAGWFARDNAVDTDGAKPMSQKTKDRIAQLRSTPNGKE